MKAKKDVYTVNFLNPKKKFKPDFKEFDTYEQAKKWCLKTMDKFHPDFIKIN
jgi:hypothetical protein